MSGDEAMTVAEAAQHFKVDPATVRRWLTAGCPYLRRGRRGPGGGAVLDLEAVQNWRDRPGGPAGSTVDEIMEDIATVLLNTVMQSRVDLRVGITTAEA